MQSRHGSFPYGEVDHEPHEEIKTHVENKAERVEIMEKLLTMLLVAFDTRRNPAARLLSYQASVASRAIVQFAQSLFSVGGNESQPSAAVNSRRHHKKRKHGRKVKYQSARKYAQIKKIK